GMAADLDHRLRAVLGLLAQARAAPAAEDQDRYRRLGQRTHGKALRRGAGRIIIEGGDGVGPLHLYRGHRLVRDRTVDLEVGRFLEAEAVQEVLRHRLQDVDAVLHERHVALLAAVVGRNGALHDAETSHPDLYQDLRVEVILVAAPLERNLLQRVG